MLFERIAPDPNLRKIIECYWIVEDDDPTPQIKKIIPDGFTEIIVHAADPYRICMQDTWQSQSGSLIAGQISSYFFLENTGKSSITGIKLKPTALTRLFDLSMNEFTDRVVDTGKLFGVGFHSIENKLRSNLPSFERVEALNHYFNQLLDDVNVADTSADLAVNLLFEHHGMISIAEVCENAGVGERQLENLFRHAVGLSPKFFARILRFNYIFELVQKNNQTWNDLAYEAAYYDQAHFIRNFKSFTGESPGKYAFDEKNMANFFLRRPFGDN